MLEKNVCLNRKTILVTGCAGFIGAALIEALLSSYTNIHIVGIDCMNGYYDIRLKEFRLGRIQVKAGKEAPNRFTFVKGNIAEKDFVLDVFNIYSPEIVVNMAAQAGVRYSIENPDAYIESNVIGFFNILEACRHSISNGDRGVKHLVFASSSSVYGDSRMIPYSTEDKTDCPVSLYAATKKADEILAYSYAKMYGIPVTGLRFFTVYGPVGRPDMAYFDFTDKLISGRTIDVYNYGNCKRDFTYIDDVVIGINAVMECSPIAEGEVRYKLYNIGNHSPVRLLDFIDALYKELKSVGLLNAEFDLNSHIRLVGMQPGDVEMTYADVSGLERDFGFRPRTDLKEGLHNFVEWYSEFYR